MNAPLLQPPTKPQPYRMDVRALDVLIEAGCLQGRIDLLDGELHEMPPQGTPHRLAVTYTLVLLQRGWALPKFISVQATHRFGPSDAPEPDLCLLDQPPVPGAKQDALPRLVVEVSESTLREDLDRKRLSYARYGVPEYWVLDLRHRRLHVFREPDSEAADAVDAWGFVQLANETESISPLCSPTISLKVSEMIDGPPAATSDPA